jgi:hypothetical protein
MAHFLPCTEIVIAEETTTLFLHGLYRLHGLPCVLVSDRDPKFVSGFWQTFCRRLGTRLNMSSGQHPETDGLAERVNNTFQQLLRCFCCYNDSDWTTLLPQVQYAYNASRALGIEHTTFEANFGFSLEEPHDLLFSMRPSIPISQDAIERLRLLQEVHTLVRSVLQLHKDEMQARTEPSTTPHFTRGNKVSVVIANLFLRGQPNRKLRDRQLGPFTVEEQIGKHSYRLKLPATVRLHPVFHVNNLRPCATAPLRPAVPVTVPEGDDEEFDVSHISDVCIKSLLGRRGKYLLFMTHFNDDDIPPVRHRLNEVHRTTTLQDFLETPQWHKFPKTHVYIDFMHVYRVRIPES